MESRCVFLPSNCFWVLSCLWGHSVAGRATAASSLLVNIHQPFSGVSECAETSMSQEPPGCLAEMGVGLGAHAQRRTPEETSMPWRLHNCPETHAGFVVSKAPAKGRCWARDSQSPRGNSTPCVQREKGPHRRLGSSFWPYHKICPPFS